MAICDCQHGARDWACQCYETGHKRGMEEAVDNAWRSTLDESAYKAIAKDRDKWRAMYEELVRHAG